MAMSLTSDKFNPDDLLAVDREDEVLKSTESLEVKEIQEDVVNESFKQEQALKRLTMKKSQSDILNSNDIPSEFQMNREKILGSALTRALIQDDNMNPIVPPSTPDELTDAQKNKLKVLSHEFNFFEFPKTSDSEERLGKPLTDAEKNKLKVLSTEFDLDCKNRKTPEILVENAEILTNLQKNRQKVMAHEFGMPDEELRTTSDPDSEFTRNRQKILGQTIFSDEFLNERKMTLDLGVETDRARNKRKILQSEYNIVTNLPDYSPMSIGSDVCDVRELPRLKIDELPTPETRFGVPNTAIINEKTPESGLNFDDKDGFHFPDPNESNRSFFEMNLPRRSLTNGYRNCEDDELFRDFMDAVLQVKPDFFKMELSEMDEKEDFNANNYLKKLEEIKSIDVVGITNHIQMSLLIPLNAHLEVLNNEILRMYLVDLDILAHFKSLRNYFFMMDGEFGTTICYGLQKKLEQGATPEQLLNFHTLHKILSNAVDSSIYGELPIF
jgi:gamma-tubulin complex component 6